MRFEDLYVDPRSPVSRGAYIPALIVVLAAAAFFAFVVTGRTAQWCNIILIYPFAVLIAGRLNDMGRPGWLALAPGLLLLAAAWSRLYAAESALTRPVGWASLIVAAGFVLWGLAAKGRVRSPETQAA